MSITNHSGLGEKLTESQFNEISKIAHAEAGLVLVSSKSSMISSRLSKRLKALKLPNLDSYFDLLNSRSKHEEIPHLLSALTTNVSHFFREEHHFETLSNEIIPNIAKKAKSGERIRIWSAGCSNGQELYSIVMTFAEKFPEFSKYDVKFLGTDIDPIVVQRASSGIYEASQLKGLSSDRVEKFTQKIQDGRQIEFKEEIKKHTTFKNLNLIGEWPMRHSFDIIFCRNVVIYFDESTQEKLWRRFDAISKKESWLFLGHSERIQDTSKLGFSPAGVTSYKKLESPNQA